MAKNLKKYEVTVEGLTVDFRKALTGADEYKYHERFCNSFSNLVWIITTPFDSEAQKDIQQETRQELYSRAYNYCRHAHGWDAHTACLLADALCKKVDGYRRAA